MTALRTPRALPTPETGERAPQERHFRSQWLGNSRRTLVYLVVGVIGLGVGPGKATAHGGAGHGGIPVTLSVVLWVPVMAGLLGGIVAVHFRKRRILDTGVGHTKGVLGLLLVVLGGTFAIAAVTHHPLFGISGGCVGVLAMLWSTTRNGDQGHRRDHHADLTFGGVCTHRVFEGLVLGTLYTTGSSIGVVGVAVVAGHTALETAAVGGLYSSRWRRALFAITLVQIGYLIGALLGVGLRASIPASAHIALLGLLAGVLLIAGTEEIRHSSMTRYSPET